MFRVRFHGRGGQGMKTASRMLGSAAFQAGFLVQDSPIYGAERRGAPMAAFTRIAREPIRERGAIVRPDLVVVADDTLWGDPAAQPLAGCDGESTALINSTQDVDQLQQTASGLVGRILVADFTALALDQTASLASLSTALGVAAIHLVGLTAADALVGVDQELTGYLTVQQHAANLELARAVSALVSRWEPLRERHERLTISTAPLADVPFEPPRTAAPSIYSAGNSPQRHTGSWRQYRPVLHEALCTRCWICFVRCPEAAISLTPDHLPVVDYAQCKGCLLCVHECPTHALTAEKEVR
jgi:pyruvate ferredoxin oxidoreductase gamma subunit